MSNKLQITLDEEATKKYLEWAGAKLEAEINECLFAPKFEPKIVYICTPYCPGYNG